MFKVCSYSYSQPVFTNLSDFVDKALDLVNTSITTTSIPYVYVNLNSMTNNDSSQGVAEILPFSEMVKKMFKVFDNKPFPKYEVYVNEKAQEIFLDFYLAGYSKSDIEIEEDTKNCNVLVKVSEAKTNVPSGFEKVSGNVKKTKLVIGFSLPKYGFVDSAKFEDGILRLKIKVDLPKEEIPKKIVVE